VTTIDNRPTIRRTQITPYTSERRIVGTPMQVAHMVDLVRRSGHLVAMTDPRLTPENDGRVYVTVRVVLPPPIRSTRVVAADRRRRALRIAGRVSAAVIPVTGAAVAVVYAVSRLVAALVHLLPYLGIGLVVALLVWRALGRAGVCPGLHCPGCSHGGHR
jgi:hypothetical protein